MTPGSEILEEKIEGPDSKREEDYADAVDCHCGQPQLCDVHERVWVKRVHRGLHVTRGCGPKNSQPRMAKIGTT
jgi:hypothetical protein